MSRGTSTSRTVWLYSIGVILLIALIAAAAVRITVQNLPPGTTVAGSPVSSLADVRRISTEIATRLQGLPVVVATDANEVEVSAGMLGATFDQTGVNRQAADSIGLDDWTSRIGGGRSIELSTGLLFTTGQADEVASRLSTQARDGDVEITASGVRVTDPIVGVQVTPTMVSQAFREAAGQLNELPFSEWPNALQVDIQAEVIQPTVTQVSVDAAVARIEELTATPVELQAEAVGEDAQTVDGEGVPPRETISITLEEDALVQLLGVRVEPDAIQRDRLQVIASEATPPPALTTFLDRAEVQPTLAITVEDRSPTPTRITPEDPASLGGGGVADNPAYADISTVTGRLEAEVVEPGLRPDLEDTINQIVAAMRAGDDTADVAGQPITEAEPADLGITEPISTFTTFYEPGQGRVTNIHRIAAAVDGALVPPGGNYDLNHAVGERTAAGGYVPAGAILDGEFITDVGGGVSQFATTFFNAMWFAGLDIITHTPHSFYFDRYPAGREATIDYPGVDLEVNNNSPYWILIDTAVTENSVTVTFWSTDWFDVQTTMGSRQPTDEGFRIVIQRRSESEDGMVDDDQFTVDYKLS